MKNIAYPTFMAILMALLFSSCGPTISYLPSESHTVYTPAQSLKVYWEKPLEPYEVLGMLIGTGLSYEEVFTGLKQKALAIGADALIMRAPAQETIPYAIEPFPPYYLYDTTNTTTLYKLDGLAVKMKQVPPEKKQ